MWVFTETGFVSVVKRGESMVVRSRDRESLEALSIASKSEILHTPFGDYPYRLISSTSIFSNWLALMAENISYGNFKSQVAITRDSDFAKALEQVWSIMHSVEDSEARDQSI
jgi:hypothetical protein